ncbi:MAG: helix-turn-helix domain-containing protein, partial [Thermoplasmata archaeon]
MQGREQAIERIRGLLEQVGFLVTDAHGIRPTSFDLMARRDSQLLILKILKNIDALAPEEGDRMLVLGRLLHGAALIVGQNSGSNQLETGVVYSRYGVPILTEEALEEYLIRGVPPFLLSSPGGVFARIDGVRLRELRERRGLSLGALAAIAGVTRRTIQLYEEGGGAEVSVVERLEVYLNDTVARPLTILEEPAAPSASDRPPGPTPPR